MRILFLTQYYPPETGAAQNRIYDLCERLAMSGHGVTVLTALPNYPQGKIFEKFKGTFIATEEMGAIKVVRTWIYATRNKGFISRLANYFSFVLTSLLGALLKVDSQDIIVVESPPLFLGISGLLISWLWRAKLVFNVSDLWPKSAVDLGVLNNRFLIRFSTMLEEQIYRRSDLVTGQTEGIVSDVRQRTSKPVLLYTNGIDPSLLHPAQDRDGARSELGFLNDNFLVGYVGLHGLAQGLDTLLLAAGKLLDRKEICFVFVGDGPEKNRLQALASEQGLSNVFFFPPKPRSSVPRILSALDAAIVPLRRLDLFRGALPNKLFESMGGGVPVIVSIEGEAKNLVERAEGGLCIPPEDAAALAEAVLYLQRHPEIRRKMGDNGRRFVTQHYDRRAIALQVETALIQLLREPSNSPFGMLGVRDRHNPN